MVASLAIRYYRKEDLRVEDITQPKSAKDGLLVEAQNLHAKVHNSCVRERD